MSVSRSRVAVVNDDLAFIHVLDALLRDEGHDTLILEAGAIAHEAIKQQRPDLVVLDISLQKPTTSWQLVDLLAIEPHTADIPVILCAVSDQTLKDRAPRLEEQGYRVVEKPFAIDELIDVLRQQLRR